MKPTKIYPLTIAAGSVFRLLVSGEYFKIMSSTAAVTVRAEWGTLADITAGQGLQDAPFSHLIIENNTAGPVDLRILIGDPNFVDGLSGAVDVKSSVPARSSAFTNTQNTVTNASAQLVAANSQRNYLLIQNNHASANVFVVFGAAATTAAGVKVIPGGAYELAGAVSTQAVFAIGDAASNTAVIVVEG